MKRVSKAVCPKCYGEHGMCKEDGGPGVEACFQCSYEDDCSRLARSWALRSMQTDLDLLTQNGLKHGWLFCFRDLK